MASSCRSAAFHGCRISNKVSTAARSPWLQSTSFRPLSNPPRIKKNAARAALVANPAPSIPNLDPFVSRFTDGSPYFNNSFINIEEKQQHSSANETFTSENLDGWLRESIHEIVGNIGEAPFLVHLFSGSDATVKLEREAATAEMWSRIKKRWDDDNHDSCASPDGIVLVQELKDDDEDGDDDDEDNDNSLWGLVVQGRGAAGAACYILDTCRVRSSLGFCTHFFLMRAQCFGEPTEVQLRKAWLQQERRK